MHLLGIDPGTAATGYGVIATGGRMRALDHGVITTPAGMPLELRLARIHDEIAALLEQHAPEAVALEDLYIGGNPRTILAVGHARGAILTACGRAGVPAAAYPPAAVKQAVCGFGAADKAQVQRMVGLTLAMPSPPKSDHAADALAVALCHALADRSRRLEAAAT
jgi:crossover junction endodeoxyribonuclease RuvC